MNCFKVGFSRRIISPEVGARLYGYPGARASKTLHDNLFTNVLAFATKDELALMISVDLCTLPQDINADLRQKIEIETGIPADKMILSTIHTHSGPMTAGTSDSDKGWGSANMEYIYEVFFPQTIAATKEAIEGLQDAKMGIGEVSSNVGINRRETTPEGTVILGQNPDGPFDSRMMVLSFKNTEDKEIVSLIHYGCHPTAAGQAPEISRDWPGYMVDRLEKETGAPAVFLNGAEGDIGPRLSNGMTTGDMKLMKEVGVIAGEDAVQAYKSISSYCKPDFSVKSDVITLPYRKLPTIEETKSAMAALGDPEKLIEVDVLTYERYENILAHYEQNLPIETEWNFQQTYIALGSVVFVPYPMEMFCQISLNQQKCSPFEHTLCLSNANGSIGYLPTKDQIPFGGYEIDSFQAFNVFVLEEDAAHQIVEKNTALLNQLFNG